MNTWPDSIPAYLHNTAMGESIRMRLAPDLPQMNMDGRVIADLKGLGIPFETGAAIKAKRTDLGMSQTEIAQALDCTASNISQIEARETIDRKTDLAFRAIFAAKQANQE